VPQKSGLTITHRVGHPLGGAYLRVRRASEHLAYLKQAIDSVDALWKSSDQEMTIQVDLNTSEIRPIFPDNPPPMIPSMCGLVVGETVYNLRAALDYLVYELAILDSGSPQEGTQFLIEDCKKSWKRRWPTYMKGISVKHRTQIEELQPYNRGYEWTAALRDISNSDKHREWTVVATVIAGNVTWQRGSVGSFEGRTGGFIHRATLASGTEIDVYVDHNLGRAITLDDGTPVIETLEQFIARVGETLDAFKPEFEGA
jgi:hypothetical protein